MNRITNVLAALGLFFSFIIVSCEKETFPDNASDASGDEIKSLKADNLPNDIVLEWSNIAFETAGGALEQHPMLASRNEAMMHIAMHDALNAIRPAYQQYAYHSQGWGSADPVAAAASAAHAVLKATWPGNDAMLDAKLAASLASIPDGTAKTQGMELGTAAANAILAMRSGDNAYQVPVEPVPVSTVPGVYNAVPPNDFMYAKGWTTMQLFSLESQDQFRALPPPPLNQYIYARDVNEIKEVGELNSVTRTADQTSYAHFWYELADIGWNRVARVVATDHHTGLYTTARLFALLNMAIIDTYIACWDSKYFYYTWRPYTAIRAADTDGNNRTDMDPNWEPLMITPPVPEYPSGHASLANAAAAVLAGFYGTNTSFTFSSTTSVNAGDTRSFKSFRQAADENADSRVVAGIHFRFACVAGQKLGDRVGKYTLQNYLKPLH